MTYGLLASLFFWLPVILIPDHLSGTVVGALCLLTVLVVLNIILKED